MVKSMKHTTNITTNFSYQTDYNSDNGELVISLFRVETQEEITLNWWEANILLEKLKLEFCQK